MAWQHVGALLLLALSVVAHNPKSRMPQQDPTAWCNTPSTPIATQGFQDVLGLRHEVQILQRVPVVAVVRGFATEAECAEMNVVGEHWLQHPLAKAERMADRHCGCYTDVLVDHGDGASAATRVNNRTAALLRSLSTAAVPACITDIYRAHADASCAHS